MKKRIIIILVILSLSVFTSGITYSVFNSSTQLVTPNQEIATFIFEANHESDINIPISEMLPGNETNHLFEVVNYLEEKQSNVNTEYQIIIKTYHFIPLIIELYKTEGSSEVLLGTCDESFSRNELNELVCSMPEEELNNSIKETNKYKLRLKFPEEFNSEAYSGLVDFINLELKSWQKI
ncbi:MAG: hypothetical protein PHF21_01590 [Bacilli bacterium]|nr:hypothetical protein [Bacilli bacterium]